MRASSPRRPGRARHPHPAGRPVPRGCVVAGLNILVAGGTQAGQDHAAQLPGRGDPRARAGRSRARRCSSCEIPLPDVRRDADPAAQPRGHRRDPAAPPGQGGAADAAVADHRRRGPRRRSASTCCIALNSGVPGMCTIHANSAREAIVKMCTLPLLAGENVGSRFVVPTVACRSTSSCTLSRSTHDGRRRVREIVAVPGRVEGDVVEIGRLFVSRGGPAGAGRRLPAARPSGSSAAGFDLPRAAAAPTTATQAAPEWASSSDCCSGSACFWSGWSFTGTVTARSEPSAGVASRGSRDCSLRPASRRSPGQLFVALLRRLRCCRRAGARRVSRVAPVALASASMAAYAPVGLVRLRARAATCELRELWPDAVDNLASAVRAGLALPEALQPARRSADPRAAPAVRSVRRGLPRDRPFPRLPRPAQGAAGRPGRRPDRRVAADRPRGRRLRPRPAAADAVGVPARGRAHPCRARDAAGLDGQRGAARGRGAVDRARAAVLPADVDLRPTTRPAAGVVLAVGGALCPRRLPADGAASAGCRRKSGCCGERDALAGVPCSGWFSAVVSC